MSNLRSLGAAKRGSKGGEDEFVFPLTRFSWFLTAFPLFTPRPPFSTSFSSSSASLATGAGFSRIPLPVGDGDDDGDGDGDGEAPVAHRLTRSTVARQTVRMVT